MSKAHFVVTAVGENRTGIVADVSAVVFNSGCNIEDSQMSLLGDQFALLTLVSSTRHGAEKDLSSGCELLMADKAIHAAVFSVGERWPDCRQTPQSGNYTLRVVGQDRSGIVFRTSEILADCVVDIIDLATHITRAPESGIPIFTMDAQLWISAQTDVGVLRGALKALANEMVIDISLKKNNSPVS